MFDFIVCLRYLIFIQRNESVIKVLDEPLALCRLTKFGDSQKKKLGISHQAVLVGKLFLFNSSSLGSDKW